MLSYIANVSLLSFSPVEPGENHIHGIHLEFFLEMRPSRGQFEDPIGCFIDSLLNIITALNTFFPHNCFLDAIQTNKMSQNTFSTSEAQEILCTTYQNFYKVNQSI